MKFDLEDYGNNIVCRYDFGNHSPVPVFLQCARCFFTKGILVPLCEGCGFRMGDLKLCNECYHELEEKREKEWL